jgi:hypothetical protein
MMAIDMLLFSMIFYDVYVSLKKEVSVIESKGEAKGRDDIV